MNGENPMDLLRGIDEYGSTESVRTRVRETLLEYSS